VKFARVVFTGAGVWGIIILTPMYFMFDLVGRSFPYVKRLSTSSLFLCFNRAGESK